MDKSPNLTNQLSVSETIKPKQWFDGITAKKFLCENSINLEELYKTICGTDFKSTYTYLIGENTILEDIFEEVSTSRVNELYSDTLFFFSKRKQVVFNADQITRITEFVTIMNNMRACADGLVLLTEDMKKLYSFISENGVLNQKLDDVLKNEKCNRKAERVLKQIKKDGNFDKLANNLIISPSLKYDLDMYKNISLGDILLDLKLSEISNYVPKTKLNNNEKLAILSKIVSETTERSKMAKRLIEYINPPAFYKVPKENQHHVVKFNALHVERLINSLKDSAKTKEQKEITTKLFGPLEERLEVGRNGVAIDTFEIENDILPYILDCCPEKLSALSTFLKSAKTTLPIEASKLPLYINEITRNCDNKTIDDVFVIKNGSKLKYFYEFNPDKYRKEHGKNSNIRCESIDPSNHKKSRNKTK